MRMCESNALVLSRLVLTRLVLRDSGRMFRVSLLRLSRVSGVVSLCVVCCLCCVCLCVFVCLFVCLFVWACVGLCVFASRNSVRT